MRFPISLPLQLCAYILSFPRYNDLLVENLRFSPFLPTPVSFKAITRVIACALRYEIRCRNTILPVLPENKNRTIIRSLILSQFQRQKEGQSDTLMRDKND